MDGVDVGRHARISRAIIDKRIRIPPHTVIGEDPDEDRKRFFVDSSGIVVIPKGTLIEAPPAPGSTSAAG